MFESPKNALNQMQSYRKQSMFLKRVQKSKQAAKPTKIEIPIAPKKPAPPPQVVKVVKTEEKNPLSSLDHLMKDLDPSLEITTETATKPKLIAIVLQQTNLQKKIVQAIQDQFFVKCKPFTNLKEVKDVDFLLTSKDLWVGQCQQESGYFAASLQQIETWILLEDKEYENVDKKRALWNSLKKKLS